MRLIDSLFGGLAFGLRNRSSDSTTIAKMDTSNTVSYGITMPVVLLSAGISYGIYKILRSRDEARDRREEARDRRDELLIQALIQRFPIQTTIAQEFEETRACYESH